MGDTIAAVATPLGTGGVGMVRISGVDAFVVADRVVRTVRGERVAAMRGYTCAYGHIVEGAETLDEAVVTVFRAPHSFTGEDTVELTVHGGVYLLERVLKACCQAGARPAAAGEFTKRAFLNGKLDLTGAEAVADLIAARGKQAARAALSARDGALFRAARQVCERLTEQAGHLAAWIDYPDEEIADLDDALLAQVLDEQEAALSHLLETYDTAKLVREGIETVIIGRPNAGKSTLMNLLAGETRSIVADLAGTTRDVVSDTVRLGELLLRLSDTAGMRESGDVIEMAGVKMAKQRLERAQLVLAVFDGSTKPDENDRQVIDACAGFPAIALVNKSDLPQKLDVDLLVPHFERVISLSAKNGTGAQVLQETIERLFALDRFDASAAVVANERQRGNLAAARGELQEAAQALAAGVSYDAVAVCMEHAIGHLLELTGEKAAQAVVDQVFARFCVGK